MQNVTNGEFYSKPTWPGAVFMERNGVLLSRVLYVCAARDTTPHADPVPQIYVPLTRGLKVKVGAWTKTTGAGERSCMPSKNEREHSVKWRPCEREVELEPGKLILVMSDYDHWLIGEGILAILYPHVESEVGQWVLTREDYDMGLTVLSPPRAEMEVVLGRLAALHAAPAEAGDSAVIEAADGIEALLAPAPGERIALDPEVADLALKVRKRCRLRRFQCELNARIILGVFADEIGVKPRHLERVFRNYFKTSVCSYVRFLRQAAAMEYYAREQRRALPEEGKLVVSMTRLSQEVHYLDEAQFANHFRGFHGIAPVMFYLTTYFRLIERVAEADLLAAA